MILQICISVYSIWKTTEVNSFKVLGLITLYSTLYFAMSSLKMSEETLTVTEVAWQALFAWSAAAFHLDPLDGGPGVVGWLRGLAVVDLLMLAPPQAPPFFLCVAVGHVAELIWVWRDKKSLIKLEPGLENNSSSTFWWDEALQAPTHIYIGVLLFLSGASSPPSPAPALGLLWFIFWCPSQPPSGPGPFVPAAHVTACILIVLLPVIICPRCTELLILRAVRGREVRRGRGVRRVKGGQNSKGTPLTCYSAWTRLRSPPPCCRSPGRSDGVASCSWPIGSGFWLAAGCPSRPLRGRRRCPCPSLLLLDHSKHRKTLSLFVSSHPTSTVCSAEFLLKSQILFLCLKSEKSLLTLEEQCVSNQNFSTLSYFSCSSTHLAHPADECSDG